MHIGLDFGTTNSGAAVFDGQRVTIFPLDPLETKRQVIRTLLYVTQSQEILIGRQAIDTYYQQNIGRPSKMVQQYVGEVEMMLGDVGSVKGYPINLTVYAQKVFALVDELTPGRLLRSLKSGLASSYDGTTILGRYYTLEALIATFLRQIKERVETAAGRPVNGVVLGRPVHFVDSTGPKADGRAQERLRRAAEAAGFQQITFELEPVAAALHYELTSGRGAQNVAVFDLGGGTLDVTVMRLGGTAERQIYASGGAAVAGDIFDRRIIEGTVLDHFGRHSTWGADGAPFPAQYTDALLSWQTLLELNNRETLRFLRLAQSTSSHPKQIRALESLVINNYGMRLYDQVEQAKIDLSQAPFATVQLKAEAIDLWQPLARSQFQALIAAELDACERCIVDAVTESGLRDDQIDAIVCTGGSSQIPCVIDMLRRRFGPKVVLSDLFSGVTAGLAIQAHAQAMS